MVAKRKRAALDSGAQVAGVVASEHEESENSQDERNAPLDKTESQNGGKSTKNPSNVTKLAPFESGAELHQSLKTTSADLLRLLLTRLRAQNTLSFAEDTERSSIPASDKRIEVMRDYCQLCEAEATNSATASSAAKSLFSTWELADKQNLPTLLHLPIFTLAQALALLSIHYPTQALGENIINRILSPNEPWFGMLQTYISNLGGAKFAMAKNRDAPSKGSDIAAISALILLREISTFARGRHAVKVFESFNWGMKVLPQIFNMRRRNKVKAKNARSSDSKSIDASLRRPDIRTLWILFLLSFLKQGFSSSLKVRLLDLGRDFLPAMLKGLKQDSADVVQTILLHLHEDLIKDEKISRSKKVEFWNEWACECVVKLYAREDDHVLIHSNDTDQAENPSVAELAHHFLLSICTNPGFGICYPDRGWYPRKATQDASAANINPAAMDDGLLPDEDGSALDSSSKKSQQSGSIHNKVLSGVLRQLAVAEDLRQQELALSILQACPELVGPYLESSCAGLTVDPRPSSRWLCNMAFFGRVVGLGLPSFTNAKAERLEGSSDVASAAFSLLTSYPANPPPMSTTLANLIPSPFHRHLFSQGINHADRLVRYSTCALLCRCLDRMTKFREVCEQAIIQLDEGSEGPWRKRLQSLEIEARKRLPDVSVVIQILQASTGSSGQPRANGRASTVDTEDSISHPPQVGPPQNMISVEVTLRLLWLYHLAVPSSVFDVRFNAGRLLTNSFMQTSSDAKPSAFADDHEGDEEAINLNTLCQVQTLRILSLSSDTAFDWTAKATMPGLAANNLSYLGILLSICVSSSTEQVRIACQELLRRILASSSLFEHNPAELDAWIESLPRDATGSEGQQISGQATMEQSPGLAQLSEEQLNVISFLDECVLRCCKTPYRYIEASRQYLANSDLREIDTTGRKTSAYTTSDLLASPLLMVISEQFLIRVQKTLFSTETDVIGALLSFYARLLPCLAAYTLHSSTLRRMAEEFNVAVCSNSTYSSSCFAARVLVSNMAAIDVTPQQSSVGDFDASQTSKFLIDGTTLQTLRSSLRCSSRPLSTEQLRLLYDNVQQLSSEGGVSTEQLLDELDPVTENLSAILPARTSVKPGALPLLHLNSVVAVGSADVDSFMQGEEETSDFFNNSWISLSQTRLAIWIAVSRLRQQVLTPSASMQDVLEQAASLLAFVASRGCLEEPNMQKFLFAEAAPALATCDAATDIASGESIKNKFLYFVCSLAFDHLVPSRPDHRRLLEDLADFFVSYRRAGTDTENERLLALSKLAPFLDEPVALRVVQILLKSLHLQATDTKRVVLETLHVLLAMFPTSSSLTTLMLQEMSSIIETSMSSAEAIEPEVRSLAVGLIHQMIERGAIGTSGNTGIPNMMKTLLSFDDLDQSKDGLLSALIGLGHTEIALQSLRHCAEAGTSRCTELLRTMPNAVRSLLELLLQRDDISESPLTEGHLIVLIEAALAEMVSSRSDASARTHALDADRIGSCIVLALRCAEKFGCSKACQSASEGTLALVRDCSPREAFFAPTVQLVHNCLKDIEALPQLDKIVQVLMDQGLLWLVRRFAEDENDEELLASSIEVFMSIVRRTETGNIKIQMKPHLVDPVVQAAIKNRLLALRPMKLAVALCRNTQLSSSQLSRYIGAISAHSDFNAIMRGTAETMQPIRGDGETSDDANDNDEAGKTRDSLKLKETVIDLIDVIVETDTKDLLQPALITKLMPFYGASLSKADRHLLHLFRSYEEECGQSFLALAHGWTLPNARAGGAGDSKSATDALLSLDANTVFNTCTEYPRCLPLRKCKRAGYSGQKEATLPGQVYGKHADPAQRYDPVFLASLLAGAVTERKHTGLEWLSMVATNVPGLVVCGISSRCADMRQASWILLSKCYSNIQEVSFQEKDQLLMVFDLLRTAAASQGASESDANQDYTSSTASAPFLPITTTLFIAHSLRSLANPSSFVYPSISHFMLQRPELDIGDVPLLYNLLYSASDRYKQERIWMLRYLRDVARSGGRSDWKILKRRHTWELVASLYDSCNANASIGAGFSNQDRAAEDAAIRTLVEDLTYWLASHTDVATELIVKRGILTWIWQQLVREGVVSLAATGKAGGRENAEGNGDARVEEHNSSSVLSTIPRNIWVLLVAQLVKHADLDRLDRATNGAWQSLVLSMMKTSIIAADRASRSLGQENGGTNSRTGSIIAGNLHASLGTSRLQLDSMVFSAALVMEKMIWHAVHSSASSAVAVSTPPHLFSALVECINILLDVSVAWLKESLEPKQGTHRGAMDESGRGSESHLGVTEARRTCLRIHRSILGLERLSNSRTQGSILLPSHAGDVEPAKALVQLLKTSTKMCKDFDRETHDLLIAQISGQAL